ncbi:MAG: UPF0149 family protein [Myxococcales bacterium]|jgi:hypothetical protein|nr:UPF0149 family protein [Myxococcales bacterium]
MVDPRRASAAPSPLANEQAGALLASSRWDLSGKLSAGPAWTAGFFAALATGPEELDADQVLADVLDERRFDDLADADRARADLLSLYALISGTLELEPQSVVPAEGHDIAEFCRGYVRGAHWHQGWVVGGAAAALGGFESAADPGSGPDGLRHRARVGHYVAALYEHFRSDRGQG